MNKSSLIATIAGNIAPALFTDAMHELRVQQQRDCPFDMPSDASLAKDIAKTSVIIARAILAELGEEMTPEEASLIRTMIQNHGDTDTRTRAFQALNKVAPR